MASGRPRTVTHRRPLQLLSPCGFSPGLAILQSMTELADIPLDGHVRFRMFTADEGGKQGRGFSGNGWFFNCPLLAPDGSYWDCRIYYGHQDLHAGVEYEFGFSYLSPSEAPLHLPPGSAVTLGLSAWLIGHGNIID